MFWGCFSYDKKGPFHIWSKKTAAEKKQPTKELDEINEAIEKDCKLEWELFTGMRRTGLRRKPGKKPVLRFTKDTGKVTREGQKGVIDWYRYQKKILIPKLLPFAKECMCDEAATGGPIQVVKVVALLAMTILDRQDEHKEESINCCRDFPCNSRNPFPYLNAVSSPLRLTRYLKHLACREVSLSRASRAHTMTVAPPSRPASTQAL